MGQYIAVFSFTEGHVYITGPCKKRREGALYCSDVSFNVSEPEQEEGEEAVYCSDVSLNVSEPEQEEERRSGVLL